MGWAFEKKRDGDLSAYGADWIAEIAHWEGDPGIFFAALFEAGGSKRHGFLERTQDGRVVLHDWGDYTSGYVDKIAEAEARKARAREQGRARTARYRAKKRTNDECEVSAECDACVTMGESHVPSERNDSQECVTRVTHIDIDRQVDVYECNKDLASRASHSGDGDDDAAIDLADAPKELRPAIEHLLRRTGRSGISRSELSDLRVIAGTRYFSRILDVIESMHKGFTARGRDPSQLTFSLILSALKRHEHRQGASSAAVDDEADDGYNSMMIDPNEYLDVHGQWGDT